MQGLVENQPQFNLGSIEVGQAFEITTVYPSQPVETFNGILISASKLELVFLSWDSVAEEGYRTRVNVESIVSDYVRIEALK